MGVKMEIRKATFSDIDRIMEIVNDAKTYLKSHGLDQWQDGYPNEESFKGDIENGESYVIVDGEIIGCMALSFRGERTYDVIDGAWLTNDKYGVIHRLAIDKNYKGKRVANEFLAFSEEVAKGQDVYSIKIDTHPENMSMQKWILNNGFAKCGIVYIRDNAVRFAYEKVIVK